MAWTTVLASVNSEIASGPQAADAALLVTALGEAVVDGRPRVRPDGADLDFAADAAADVDVAGEAAGRQAVLGGSSHRSLT
jgi:hypothetical protein